MSETFNIKYDRDMQKGYIETSLVAPHLTDEFEFTGAKTVRISAPVTVPMNDYVRSGANRYGTPSELKDAVQELTLTQDKSFALTIDKGNSQDKNDTEAFARKMLTLQLTERAIPEFDRYALNKLCRKAGTIVGNSTALTKSNIVDRICDGTVFLDDAEISQNNRTLFVSAAVYKLLKLSDEFVSIDKVAMEAVTKGVVGRFDNMKVVKVPKGRWPENVNFMIVHRSAATAPTTIEDAKIHKDPPGVSGNLLEGRNYYDCFVIASRAKGVYVEVDTSKAGICAAPTISAQGALTSTTSGAGFKYTLDGSDPRYSKTAMDGQPQNVASGTVVKAYAYKADMFDSAVSEKTI